MTWCLLKLLAHAVFHIGHFIYYVYNVHIHNVYNVHNAFWTKRSEMPLQIGLLYFVQ